MRIVIFSGTTEGRVLSHRLARSGISVTVCVATEYGREEQGEQDGITVSCGRKTVKEMQDVLRGAALCVDATHPYAVLVTQNVREACAREGIAYRRLLRPRSTQEHDGVFVASAEQAADWLSLREGNVLLTTGAKELTAFARLGGERLYPRVLPVQSSLDRCAQANIPHRNIIAMQGPFSEEMNLAVLHQYDIRWMVTKDGGAAGGFPEKVRAAERAGVTLVVIQRPEESGAELETIVRECEERMR